MIGKKLGPYEILESIGSGGMGEVWKARDTRLGRTVAIKKVKEQHSERFKQEARSIAVLNHPNICQIFDIGDDYLVLEYVDGKPLSRPLSEPEAIRLAIQIATALEAAHKKGIIHRDLKPSNIMVNEDRSVKLLDFGLAKLYEQNQSISSLPTADMPATQAGAILGTVAYMSPEQAQGKPADARSDIFSFGLVLYEMLSGRRAFSGDSNFAVMEAIVRKDPPPLKTSPPLEKIVKRCLEKQPSERYQTMLAVKKELEGILEQMQSKASAEPQPSIAVLPFADMSPAKDNEWFSDGLAEEIINTLTQIPKLKVIARTSAFAFRGKEQDITKIAEALRVNTILEGSVRKAGDRLRITAQLINASDGSHLWSERYDRTMTDVFAIQDEISHSIADKLRLRYSKESRPDKHGTENLEAYNQCLKGRYHFYHFTASDMAICKECFTQATTLDPNYALAWYWLAKYYWYMGFSGRMPRKVVYGQSNQAALKALELDERLPETHSMLGALRAIEFDWKEAEREFRAAMELDPDAQEVRVNYGWFYLIPMRRVDEAIIVTEKVLANDPLDLISHGLLGQYYHLIRQWDRAIEHLVYVMELAPNYPLQQQLGLSYIRKGMVEEGIRSCEAALRLHRNEAIGWVGLAYALAGRIDTARQLLEELLDNARKGNAQPAFIAFIHMGLGEIDQSLDWLEKAVDEHDDRTFYILTGSDFDPMRSNPRYKALLRKMNLEP